MPRVSWGFVHLFTAAFLCAASARADEPAPVDLSTFLSGGFSGAVETMAFVEPLAYSPCTNCGTPTTYRTSEYLRGWQLDKVNAAFAYARGATGAGIIIGVVDTGVELRNRDLDGNVIKTSLWAQGPWTSSTAWHGTAVSGVIAAEKNGKGIHGVAYQSKFLPYQGLGETGIGRVLDWRNGSQLVRVVNNSWGVTSSGNTIYSPNDFAYLVPLMDKAVRNDAVIVFAAGNDGQTHPQAYARMGYYMGQLDPTIYPNAPLYEGLVLAAVATDKNNVIASWSNRCGMAMYDCLAAPGVGVTSTTIGGSLVSVSGTSFSAPIISGAIAVIMDIWPGLPAKDVVQILKTTATDLGAAGVDPIYGWGLVNLDKATQPIGSLTITGGSLSGSTLSSTSLSGGGAMGTSFSKKLSGLSFTTYDDFNRDYDVALSALASNPESDLRMARMMERFTTPLQMTESLALGQSFITATAFQPTLSETEAASALHLSLDRLSLSLAYGADAWQMNEGSALVAVDPAMLAPAHLGLIDDASRMAASYALSLSPAWSLVLGSQMAFGDNDPYSDGSQTYGGELSLGLAAKDGHASITLGIGSIYEDEGFLGATGEDLTALGAGETNYMSLGGTIALTDGLALAGQVSLGQSQVEGASGSLVTAGKAYSLGWSASLLGQTGSIDWGLGVAQPLRVESGDLDLILPVQDDSGAIVDESARVDLTPSGREVVGQAWLSLPLLALGVEELGSDAFVKAGLAYRHQPDHDASKEGEAIGMMSLGFSF